MRGSTNLAVASRRPDIDVEIVIKPIRAGGGRAFDVVLIARATRGKAACAAFARRAGEDQGVTVGVFVAGGGFAEPVCIRCHDFWLNSHLISQP